ncbi:MAG: hypothetical protein K6G78_03120 [bacterium]|nr:hypothetical protein [bacterium]
MVKLLLAWTSLLVERICSTQRIDGTSKALAAFHVTQRDVALARISEPSENRLAMQVDQLWKDGPRAAYVSFQHIYGRNTISLHAYLATNGMISTVYRGILTLENPLFPKLRKKGRFCELHSNFAHEVIELSIKYCLILDTTKSSH